MIKTVRRLVLTLMVLFTFLPQHTLIAKATNSFTINGVSVQYYDFTSEPNQCWKYANNIYTKIWGVGMKTHIDTNNLLEGLSVEEKRLTLENLKTYIGYARLGSSIRLTDYDGLFSSYDFVGHSEIIAQKDENGFTVLEGGMSSPGARREHYYTWESYLRTWSKPEYRYIKYIVSPDTVSIANIDEVIEIEIKTNVETLKVREVRNEEIEKIVTFKKVSHPTSTAYARSVTGHIHETLRNM